MNILIIAAAGVLPPELGVGRQDHGTRSGQVRSGQVRVFNVHIQSKLL